MILILDTNVFHSDVYVRRPILKGLLNSAREGAFKIVVPRIVVEELVRQFPERTAQLEKELKDLDSRLAPFDLGTRLPEFPERAGEEYRTTLEACLSQPGCRVAAHPRNGAKVGEWVAQRRKPLKSDGYGAPDALVWLTVLEIAESEAGDEAVVLISANSQDFADPADKSRFHPTLRDDVIAQGVSLDDVLLVRDLWAFRERFPTPDAPLDEARRLLANEDLLDTVKEVIADEMHWAELERFEPPAGLPPVDITDAHLKDFQPGDVELIDAERAGGGLSVIVRVVGTGSVDLMIAKSDAMLLPADGDIHVYDYDWSESVAAAEVETGIYVYAVVQDVAGDAKTTVLEVEQAN